MFVASERTVDSTSPETTCSFRSAFRIWHTDLIILSQGTPIWLASGGLKIYWIPLCAQNPLIVCFSKIVPESLRISLGYPRRLINVFNVFIVESVFRLCTTSACMARTDKHMNKHPYRLTLLLPSFTSIGPKKCTPTYVKGGLCGVTLSSLQAIWP